MSDATPPNDQSMIFVAEDDFRRLRTLAAALPKTEKPEGTPSLGAELERATVVPRDQLPAGVVTVNSRVRFKDAASGDEETYVITWPERADGGVERISVLAPIGTALLGYRVGSEVSWPTPGGVRRLQILEVQPVDEASLVRDPKEEALARILHGRR